MDEYGIDLAITDDGDLAVNHAGQATTVHGTSCCAQALVLWLRAPRGTLPLHPEYGTTLTPRLLGQKTGDPTLAQAVVAADVIRLTENDRRFTGLADLTIDQPTDEPGDLHIAVAVQLGAGDILRVPDLADVRADELPLEQVLDPLDEAQLDGETRDAINAVDVDDPDYGDPIDLLDDITSNDTDPADD